MNEVVLVSGVISLVAVTVWICLLVWGAIADGRDQRRRDDLRPKS